MGRIVNTPSTKTTFTKGQFYTSNTSFTPDPATGSNIVRVTVQGPGSNGGLTFSGAGGGWAQRVTQLGNYLPQCVIVGMPANSSTTSFGGWISATAGVGCVPGCGIGGTFNYCGGKGYCQATCVLGHNYYCNTRHTNNHWSGMPHGNCTGCCIYYCGLVAYGGGSPGFAGNGPDGCCGGTGHQPGGLPYCCRCAMGAHYTCACHLTGGHHVDTGHGCTVHLNSYEPVRCAVCIGLRCDVTCSFVLAYCSFPQITNSCTTGALCAAFTCNMLVTTSVSNIPYDTCSCVQLCAVPLCFQNNPNCPYQLFYGHLPGGTFNLPWACCVVNSHFDQHYCFYCQSYDPRPNIGTHFTNGCYGSGGGGGLCTMICCLSCYVNHCGTQLCSFTCSYSPLQLGSTMCTCGGQGAIFVEW